MATDTASLETREKYSGGPLWKPWMDKEIRLRQATSIEEVEEFFEQGEDKPEVSWDIETFDLNPDVSRIVGHSICFDGNEAMYIPVRHKTGSEQNLDPDLVFKLIMKLIEPPKILVVFNWKFEGSTLRSAGIIRKADPKFLKDAIIYNWLFDSNEKTLNLKDASVRHLGLEMLDIREVPGVARDKKKKGSIDFSMASPEDATLYAAADVVMTLRILYKIQSKVDKEQAFIVDLEHRLLDPLFMMEENPITIDRSFLIQGSKDLSRWINIVASKLYSKVGYDFNIGSYREVGDFLQKIGIDMVDPETKKKLSTSAKSIEKLGIKYPEVADILLWRSLVKELGTYVDVLLKHTSDEHPYAIFKFRSVGAPTGRFSSGGVGPGETKFAPMNVQAVPSASSFSKTEAWLVLNPPFHEMDNAIRDTTSSLMLEDEEETDLLIQE